MIGHRHYLAEGQVILNTGSKHIARHIMPYIVPTRPNSPNAIGHTAAATTHISPESYTRNLASMCRVSVTACYCTHDKRQVIAQCTKVPVIYRLGPLKDGNKECGHPHEERVGSRAEYCCKHKCCLEQIQKAYAKWAKEDQIKHQYLSEDIGWAVEYLDESGQTPRAVPDGVYKHHEEVCKVPLRNIVDYIRDARHEYPPVEGASYLGDSSANQAEERVVLQQPEEQHVRFSSTEDVRHI